MFQFRLLTITILIPHHIRFAQQGYFRTHLGLFHRRLQIYQCIAMGSLRTQSPLRRKRNRFRLRFELQPSSLLSLSFLSLARAVCFVPRLEALRASALW